MNAEGQRPSVVTIFSTGDRFAKKQTCIPRGKAIQLGDKLSLTTGYKGGLTSRAGYAVSDPSQLPEGAQDYLEKLAMPYYAAVAEWLETIHVGLGGGELYEHIERVLPKSQYHWSLNPGHLSADEEWLCSPITPGSTIPLASGMPFPDRHHSVAARLWRNRSGKHRGVGGRGFALSDRERRSGFVGNNPAAPGLYSAGAGHRSA